MLDSARARGAREILFLFWLFRRAQITLSPPGMRLPFSGIAVGVLRRVSVSLACPFRRRTVDRTDILMVVAAVTRSCSNKISVRASKMTLRCTSRDLGDRELDATTHPVDALSSDAHAVAQMPGEVFGFCAAP